jgi:phospholipid/cholesterol/gamma-HCH transport system permease protein
LDVIYANTVGRVLAAFAAIGRFARFASAAFSGIIYEPPRHRVIMPLMMEIGVRSVSVVLATGAFVGMVLAVQIYAQLHKIGSETSAGPIINLSIVAELGPVLAAIILAGRVGGAMAAELGTMKVTEQLDALRTLGADPIHYLASPRFFACLVLVPLLTLYSDAIGVLGGYMMSVKYFGISEFFYWQQTRNFLERWDIFVGIAKSFFFGGSIGLISCYKGFQAEQGAEGVGRATTNAFVASFITILVGNFFLSLFFNTLYDILYLR